MKKTGLQKISNILFHILLIGSCYIVLCNRFAPWEDFGSLLNGLMYALIFFSGFFHHISYKHNSLRILSTTIIILRGITDFIFAIISENGWEIIGFVVFAILLILHIVSCGKFDGETKIHEFNVKTEDGRYEKVTFKEKIPNTANQIDAKTIIKKLLISLLVLFLVFVLSIIGWMILCFVDGEKDFKEEIKTLPTEIVSQEYFAEFNSSDYIRIEWDSLYIEKDNCYYNNDGEYIVVSEPTRMISETGKATEGTYWQMGDNKNFIMKLVDEDFGNYTRAYYINKNCEFPDEDDKIVKVVTYSGKQFKFSEKQLAYIEDLIKNFNDDTIEKDKKDLLDERGNLVDYELVFCFEGFDDIRLTCSNIVKDKNGQWYLYHDYYYFYEKVRFTDLEKLPQDICDVINESLK